MTQKMEITQSLSPWTYRWMDGLTLLSIADRSSCHVSKEDESGLQAAHESSRRKFVKGSKLPMCLDQTGRSPQPEPSFSL